MKKQKAKSDANNHFREARLRDDDVQRQARQQVGRLGRGPQAIANVVSSLRRVGMSAHGTWEGPAPDADALEALEESFWELQFQWTEHDDANDCSWLTRTAVSMLVRVLRVHLQILADAGATNWDMDSTDVSDCPIVQIMENIDACVCVHGEITGNKALFYDDFLGDVIDPVALAEAISAGAKNGSPSCGLEGEPGAVLGELIRMSSAST